MLPDHLCRRDVPGLDEAILFSEYAKLEGLTEERVLVGIAERWILGANHCGVWYVEAPAMCEEQLAEMRREWYELSGSAIVSDGGLTSEQGVAAARVFGLVGKFTVVDLEHRYRELLDKYNDALIAHVKRLEPERGLQMENELDEIHSAYRFLFARLDISPEENAQLTAEIQEEMEIINSKWPDMKRRAIEESKRSGVPMPAMFPPVSWVLRVRKKKP
jgi:hypothetical protein